MHGFAYSTVESFYTNPRNSKNNLKSHFLPTFLSRKGVIVIALNDGHDTGDFFEEWNEITPQTHIRKFEEQTT